MNGTRNLGMHASSITITITITVSRISHYKHRTTGMQDPNDVFNCNEDRDQK